MLTFADREALARLEAVQRKFREDIKALIELEIVKKSGGNIDDLKELLEKL